MSSDPRRDQDETGFSGILDAVIDALPEALCAVFVDTEGETIDLSSRMDSFEARVAGAELAVVIARLRAARSQGRAGQYLELRIEGAERTVLSRVVSEGYDLVLVLDGPFVSARAAERCARAAAELLREAGLPAPASFVSLGISAGDPRSPSGSPIARGAIIEDEGTLFRVASVLGYADANDSVEALVRCEGGQELLVARDPRTSRWIRLAV